MHVSTDYVFDGDATEPYVESAAGRPGVAPTGAPSSPASAPSRESAPRHAIVRAAWLFGPGGRNFVDTMLPPRRRARRGDRGRRPGRLPDLHRPPRPRRWSRSPSAASPAPCTSPAAAAAPGTTSPRRRSRRPATVVTLKRGTSADLGRPAPRPAYSVLVTERDDAPRLPDWREGLAAHLDGREGPRMKLLVCGGAGFIGSHFVRIRAPEHGDEVVVLDKLTYAGRAREPRRTSTTASCTARSRTRPRSPARSRACDAIVNFAAETHVDRSIAEPDAFVQDARARDLHPARGGARRRRPLRAGVHGRGLRLDRGGDVHRGVAAGAVVARTRATKAGADLLVLGLLPHVRHGDADRARLQQLRAVPVPGEADPADGAQRAARRLAAGLRRRHAGAQLDPRDRLRPRHRPRPRPRRPRRGLQRRRARRVPEPRGRQARSSAPRAADES